MWVNLLAVLWISVAHRPFTSMGALIRPIPFCWEWTDKYHNWKSIEMIRIWVLDSTVNLFHLYIFPSNRQRSRSNIGYKFAYILPKIVLSSVNVEMPVSILSCTFARYNSGMSFYLWRVETELILWCCGPLWGKTFILLHYWFKVHHVQDSQICHHGTAI